MKAKKVIKIVKPKKRVSFGAVSRISTAPVAIGNSMTGFDTKTITTRDGVKVIGRDFGFTAISTGTVTNWCLAGGLPTNPFCYTSSVLQNCARMYNRYKPRRLVFHYITSSATSQTGDVMFYLRKNEGSTMPQPTASTFLNYVLSDSNTVIGPQWTNHTATFDTNNCPWMSTDYGATSDLGTYNQYDLFLYSKTSASNSPGYIVVDYEFEFKEISIGPRSGNLAEIAGAKAIWQPVNFTVTAALTTDSSTFYGSFSGTTGVGSTTITPPSTNQGDVWEFILDVTNSSFGSQTAANAARAIVGNGLTSGTGQTQLVTLTDGMVLYAVDTGVNVVLYFTKDAAFASTSPAVAGSTATYNTSLRGFCRLVGSVRPLDLAYLQ